MRILSQRPSRTPSTVNDLRRPYRLFHDIYVLLDDGDRQLLDEFGLNPSQYRLLYLLRPGDGQRLTVLSNRLLRSKSTVTRIVNQLELAGLVQRSPDNTDHRAQRVVLTQEGIRLRERVSAGHNRSLRRRLSVLTAPERNELASILAKLREGLIADLGQDGGAVE